MQDGPQHKPASVTVEVRGQIPPLRQILGGLTSGLILALIVIVLLLTGSPEAFKTGLDANATAMFGAPAGVYDATVQLGVASNVTTFTLSDFGRAFQPNTGGGTDHWDSIPAAGGLSPGFSPSNRVSALLLPGNAIRRTPGGIFSAPSTACQIACTCARSG